MTAIPVLTRPAPTPCPTSAPSPTELFGNRKVPAVVGFAGLFRAGKDTAAAALLRHGFIRLAFGDPIRDAVKALDPWVHGTSVGWWRLSDLFAEGWNWETLKHSPYQGDVRRLLQRAGTEMGRGVLGADVWTNAVTRKADQAPGPVVASDVRFADEAAWVHDRGGVIIEVVRPVTGSTETGSIYAAHASEIIDFRVDHTIINDGNTTDLQNKVRAVLGIL